MGEEEKENRRFCALIVDDSQINREILRDILKDELDTDEARNGEEAIRKLMDRGGRYDIVLLDLIMPNIDGFGVLEFMQQKHMTETLPVIMISTDSTVDSMERAYDLGAIDFITRPFSNRIVLRRVLSALSLFNKQKQLAAMIDQRFTLAEREIDDLTGLPFDKRFFKDVRAFLTGKENGAMCLVAADIDHFKLFNNYYGYARGDEYLKTTARLLEDVVAKFGGVAGYLGADDFAFVTWDRAELYDYLTEASEKHIQDGTYEIGFTPKFGIYPIDDLTVPLGTMYDRSLLALSTVKGDYATNFGWYNQDILREAEDEFNLLTDFQRGMKEHEFVFYMQPKCNMHTGRIIGAEALVRWEHKERGLLTPNLFVPILEKNGFILQLDHVIWESVAKWLHDWRAAGHDPVPVSVNVSRADIFGMNVTKFLSGLVQKYGLKPEWLEIEITESAFVEDVGRVNEEVEKLHAAGFTVLMDDFGSGYSSLNSLKDMNIDILKIDMKFLRINYFNMKKGIGILESIINMARQLRMPTIVEGVETRDQVQFLTSAGCEFAQGYYFYKPVPLSEYERLIADDKMVDHSGVHLKKVDPIRVREFLDENVFSDAMLNNILGPVAFYEVHGNEVKIARVNEQYYNLMKCYKDEEILQRNVKDMIVRDDLDDFFAVFRKAKESVMGNGAETCVRARISSRVTKPFRLRVFFLRSSDTADLFYAAISEEQAYVRMNPDKIR